MTSTMTSTKSYEAKTKQRNNGLEIEKLVATVNAIQAQPDLGICCFRAQNKWIRGNRNRTTVQGFYGACQEMAHEQTFVMEADEPGILAGEDTAANPVEHLLHALASCLTTAMVAHAAVRGIEIEEMESRLEGDLDLKGLLGLADVPKGYTNIRAKFRVKAKPEDVGRIQELANFSPVFNTITKGAKVDVEVSLK